MFICSCLPHLIYSSLTIHLDKSSLSSQLLQSSCLCPAKCLSISYISKESYQHFFNQNMITVLVISYSACMLIEKARSICPCPHNFIIYQFEVVLSITFPCHHHLLITCLLHYHLHIHAHCPFIHQYTYLQYER